MRLPTRALAASVTTAAVLLPTAAPAAEAPSFLLTASGHPGGAVSGLPQLSVGGGTTVTASVSTLSGGSVTVVDGPGGGLPTAVRFPTYVSWGSYPRAVLNLTPSSGGALSPGAADFEYGVVARLGQASPVSAGRPDDNGDNAFQRGLYDDPSQFKLEFDRSRPACTVRGSAGRVIVVSHVAVRRGTWYTVSCTRTGSRLSVRVSAYGSAAEPVVDSAWGGTGSLAFPASLPAAVGGKLAHDGAVLSSASDQFNGAIAEVWTRTP